LVDLMRAGGGALLDVQWTTPHLASLGAVDVTRARYLELVADAVAAPTMSTFPDRSGR
jgi:leucyl/phenylalanyl-tRNA--protein transferase